MTPLWEIASALALACVLAIGLAQLALRFIYSYAITDDDFEVRLLGRIPVYAIPLETIVAVGDWSWSPRALAQTFTAIRLGNRLFGRAVVIERRARFPRYVIFTPDDPDATIARIAARIA